MLITVIIKDKAREVWPCPTYRSVHELSILIYPRRDGVTSALVNDTRNSRRNNNTRTCLGPRSVHFSRLAVFSLLTRAVRRLSFIGRVHTFRNVIERRRESRIVYCTAVAASLPGEISNLLSKYRNNLKKTLRLLAVGAANVVSNGNRIIYIIIRKFDGADDKSSLSKDDGERNYPFAAVYRISNFVRWNKATADGFR